MCFSGEPPECSTEKIRKSRKEHQCFECGRVIIKGEKYKYVSGVWNREAQSFKTCLDCLDLKSEIERIELAHGCSLNEASPPFGDLINAALEYGLIRKEGNVFVRTNQNR